MQFVVYQVSECGDLLQTDDYTHGEENFIDAMKRILSILEDEQERYEWQDDTLQEMLQELMKRGSCDLLNGRFLHLVKNPDERDPLTVAREDERKNEGDRAPKRSDDV